MEKRLNLWEQFVLGLKTYIEALSFVFNNGLWIYFIYPAIISLILFFGSFSLAGYLSNELEQLIMSYITPQETEGWLSFLTGALHIFLTVGLKIVFFFIYSTFSKYITLIIMSPVMALLSERTEEIVTGKKFPFEIAQFLKDVIRGVIIAIRNMLIEFGLIFLCFLIVWIPVAGWISSLFLLIVSYYFYGFSMMDYTNERHKLNIRESVLFIRRNKGVAIGNGLVFSFIFAIPFVGSIVASVLAPVAATLATLEAKK